MQRFNSRCWNPGAESIDAFTVDWSGENNWCCPPIGQIPRIIHHAQACQAIGRIIVPLWPSAPFWPFLCPYGSDCFAPFVRECKELPQAASFIMPWVGVKPGPWTGLNHGLQLECADRVMPTTRAKARPALQSQDMEWLWPKALRETLGHILS